METKIKKNKGGRPKKEKVDEEVKPKVKLFDRHKYARNKKLLEDDTDDEDVILNLSDDINEVKILEVQKRKKRPERASYGKKRAPPRPTNIEQSEVKPEEKKPEEKKPEEKKPEEKKPEATGYTSAGEANSPGGDSGNLSDSSKLRQKLMIRHYPSGPLGYTNYGNPYNKFNPNQQYLIF